jgi:localization factor PodJL
LTLGQWLNRLISEVEEEGAGLSPRAPTPKPTGQRSDPRNDSELAYTDEAARTGRSQAAALAEPSPDRSNPPYPKDGENSRLTAALEELTRRLDMAAGPVYPGFSPPSANSFTPPLSSALSERIEAGERRAETALGRIDASLSDIRQTQAALGERLRTMESHDPNHKSLAALRGLETALARLSQQVFDADVRTQGLEERIDEKLAQATSQMATIPDLDERVGAIEQVTQQALETLDTSVSLISQRLASTEAVAGDTSQRLADAMVDLSARLTGIEQKSDDPRTDTELNALTERLAGIEDVTTQAIEGIDQGLNLVSQRVAATEALAQSTNERLVDALIDLSARLVNLEGNNPSETARELLASLEAQNNTFARRMEALDSKIEATRTSLIHEVNAAIATGVDDRVAEVAQGLSDRLDASERRTTETFEKVGAEMARASISFEQRLRELEERESDTDGFSPRIEIAKMKQAIEERIAGLERRDAAALHQAGGHIQHLAQTLTEKLDSAEARTQSAVQNVSSQMEQLAQRLQARQDETAKNLVTRMEDGEARTHRELKSSLAQIASDLRSVEERALAAQAPLHDNLTALNDRLEQLQAISVERTNSYGDQFAYDPHQEAQRDAFGAPPTQGQASRRPGFGAPFPSMQEGAEGASGLEPFSGVDEDPFSMGSPQKRARPRTDKVGADLGDAEENDESWLEPLATSRDREPDYLSTARNAAMRAAAVRAESQKSSKKNKSTPASKQKMARAGMAGRSAPMMEAGDKPKSALSPVAVAAAAALVVTSGIIGFNYLNRDKTQNEMPASLDPATAPAPPAPSATAPPTTVAPTTVAPTTVAPTTAPPATVAPTTAPPTTVAPTTVAPTTAPQATAPQATAPKAGAPATANGAQAPRFERPSTPSPQVAPAPTRPTVATPSAAPPKRAAAPKSAFVPEVRRSPEVSRPATSEKRRAQQAPARSKAAQSRPKPASKPRFDARVRRPSASDFATPTAAPPGLTPEPAARSVQVAAPVEKPSFSPAVASSTQTSTPRPPPPRVAVAKSAPEAKPASSASSARQLYEQSMARQQAGDAAGAVALMKAAADTGDARSINRLAKMYERGEGVTRDLAQARALTERAALRGSRQAMHNLGVYYAEAEGEQRDFGKAAESFLQAANRGVVDSQFNLAAMAEQGLGGPKSERVAYYWYSLAARSGDRDAAVKARELAARLSPAEKAAEDKRVAAFKPEPAGED